MHQSDLYPVIKKRSSLDVELMAGTSDAEYYDVLRRSLKTVFESKPDIVIYQAGVDVWENDKLGGLKLTERGILDRDTAVWETCLLHRVPVVVTLGGGYGPTPEDTARLHARTIRLFAGLGASI
jgi:acetoin utilization deacetylase AcuC-like enzyme